jgi:hypothetical protein
MKLCESAAALSAALVDAEGETVDYASAGDPFFTRLAAAEWGIILRTLRSMPSGNWANTAEIFFRGRARSFAAVALDQGYALVLELPTHSLCASHRALVEAVRAVSAEAGLAVPRFWKLASERWTRVDVDTDHSLRRPKAVWREGRWYALEVLGRIARDQLQRMEAGYRVRLEDGAEVTLVREPLDRWYADDSLGPNGVAGR